MTRPAGYPELIAHRGAAASYPENTLPAIEAALRCGVNRVEIDVQFSADEQPIVIHDEDLQRTAGRPGVVATMLGEELARVSVHEERRLGPARVPIPPPTLASAAATLEPYPQARLFVELKLPGIKLLGRARVMEVVHTALGPWASKCIILSYDAGVVELAKTRYGYRTGWVLKHYGARALGQAGRLKPDVLFVDHRRVPDGEMLPEGQWDWAVYEVNSLAGALDWSARGADLVESFQACDLARQLDALSGR